jgi:hypothetical protein
MSFKDLETGTHPTRVETPEEAELRARAAARHRAKQEKAAKAEAHRTAKDDPQSGASSKGEPRE